MLPSRVLEAQTFQERPVHMLLGGISEGKTDSASTLLPSRIHYKGREFPRFPTRYLPHGRSRRKYYATPSLLCSSSATNDPAWWEPEDKHCFSPLKLLISVNMLLISENPAFARATLSKTNPIRSSKLKIESDLAASVETLAIISGV